MLLMEWSIFELRDIDRYQLFKGPVLRSIRETRFDQWEWIRGSAGFEE